MRAKPPREPLFASADIGMSGVKAGVFGIDGCCLGRCSVPLSVRTPRPGWSELDLEEVWRAFVRSTRQAAAICGRSGDVVGIGLSVASPTVVATKSDGSPLSRGLTYADNQARQLLDDLRKRVGDGKYLQLTGNRMELSMCSAASMMYLTSDEDLRIGDVRVGHLNSYLANRLTGRWVMDWTNASYTGLSDLRKPQKWSADACEALGFPTRLLPELVPPWEPLGPLTDEAASVLGLDPSVVVVAGAADTACSAFSVGCAEDGDAFESTGTSGVLTFCTSEPPKNSLFMNRSHVLPGRWLSHGAMSSVGASVRWLAEEVFVDSACVRTPAKYGYLAWLSSEAEKSEPGAGGVVFLPYLMGERTPIWDPGAKGVWIGMTPATNRCDLIRAVFESVGYGMRQMIEIAEEHSNGPIGEILGVGGGSRNRFWTSIKADITGKYYKRSTEVEAASLGAAMLAAVGGGVRENVWEVVNTLDLPETDAIEPSDSPTLRSSYDRNYNIYINMYPALKEIFEKF